MENVPEGSSHLRSRLEERARNPCRCFDTKRNVIWTTIWLLALAGCISQCLYRLRQYVYNPTTINVKYVENYTITAPCVTMCPSDLLNRYPSIWPASLLSLGHNLSYKSVYSLLQETNITPEELWNMSKIPISNKSHFISDQGGLPQGSIDHMPGIEVREINTVLGACRTYIPERDIPYLGTETGIVMTAAGEPPKTLYPDITPGYKAIFHSKELIPVIKYYARNLAITVPYGRPLNYAIRFRETTNLNTWQKPCKSEEEFVECITRCVLDQIIAHAKYSNCSLPYMESKDRVMPSCTTPDQFQEVYNTTIDVARNVDKSMRACSCGRPCKQIQYEAEHISHIPAVITGSLFFLYVSFPSSKVERVEEEFNYDYTALFSDIGGALGLFLGVSILSLLDSAEKFWGRLRRHHRRVNDVKQ